MTNEITESTDSNEYYDNVNETASTLAHAFSQKIHSEISDGETHKENGTSFLLNEKQLLALAITLDTSIRVIQKDLINVLTTMANVGNPKGAELALAMNTELKNDFEENAYFFNSSYDTSEHKS